MKSHTQYLWFNTKNRQEFVNITPQVEEAVAKSGIVNIADYEECVR